MIFGVLYILISIKLLVPIVAIEHSSYVPDNYEISFADEFDSINLDTDGSGSENWAPWWVGWNVRFLIGNNDKAWKCDASYKGKGNEKLDVVLHEITDSATLVLYGKVTPDKKREIVNDFPYVGGMISANQHFAQKYGYYEFRCKFGVSKGQHWAFWLLQADNSWPPEIDLVEVVGHQPNMVHMTAHWEENGHQSNFESFGNINTLAFHTYGFEWTKEKMSWYLDGVEMKTMDNFVNNPMYFLVSPEMGGNWTGEPDSTTVWPMYCEIDYIRIYKKK